MNMLRFRMPNTVVLVDIDGTLAHCEDRLQYIKNPNTGQMLEPRNRDWDSFHRAGCNAEVYHDSAILVRVLHRAALRIHLVTGRPERYRGPTCDWLHQHSIPFHELTMRGDLDFRSDVEYKGDVFKQYDPDSVLCILEDRDTVVHMARTAGFTVYQVRNGAF